MKALVATVLSLLAVTQPNIAHPQSGGGALDGDSLRLEGEITKEAVDRVSQALSPTIAAGERVLHINSVGGDADAAMRLGRLLRDNDVAVVVERVCAAVCALYVLPAAKRVSFAGEAVPLFAQMPSPQLLAAQSARSARATTNQEKEDIAKETETLSRVVISQDGFYRSIKVDPSQMYRIMDIWLNVNRVIRLLNSADRPVSIVPDQHFFTACLGLNNISWKDLSIEDSKRMAHMGRTPLAVIIGSDVYFEGNKVSAQSITC